MEYRVIPLNKKVLLERTELIKNEDGRPQFFFQEDVKKDVEFFRVLSKGMEVSGDFRVNEIVTVEFYQPIGNINDKELFIADEKAITSRIVELKEQI